MSILLITHDLGVVAQMANRVVVMYAGKVMEKGDVRDVLKSSAHPYTQAMLRCLPGRGKKMEAIEGSLPSPYNPPEGCRFHDRCPIAVEQCAVGEQPPLVTVSENQSVSCVYYQDNRLDIDAHDFGRNELKSSVEQSSKGTTNNE